MASISLQSRGSNAASRLVGDQMLMGRMSPKDSSSESSSSGGGGGGGNDAYRDDSQVIVDRMKIFYGWMQIFSALTITFDIPWPIQFKSFSVGLGAVNFDVGFISNLSCEMAIPYLHKMSVHAGLPFALLLTILVARLPAYYLRKKWRKQQRAMMIKYVFSLALILYPGLCTRLFASLKQVTVQGLKSSTHTGSVLAVDYSVEAFGDEHQPFVILCIVSMVIFVFGIPLAVFLALRSNRKYLYSQGTTDEHHQRHHDCIDEFGTLYLQYEPDYWYWEVTVIFKKMLLTGAMTVIGAGSSAQLVIALLIVLVNLLLVLKLGPFVDSSDDWLSFLTSSQMFLTLLGGLLVMTDVPGAPTYDPNFMGTTLLVINSFGFFALMFSLVLLHPKWRSKMNEKFETKVRPAAKMEEDKWEKEIEQEEKEMRVREWN